MERGNVQKNAVKGTVRQVAKVAASFFTITLLAGGCAREPVTYQKGSLPLPPQHEKTAPTQKNAYAGPEAVLWDSSVTVVDRQGIKHTIDLSGKMKENGILSLKGGRINRIDAKDGGETYLIYPPNSSASFMIFLFPDGKERVVSGPPM